jgi:hypothetical protein
MKSPDRGRTNRFLAVAAFVAAAYALSSGPVLASAFWLRDATGRDGLYAALYPYYPLLALGGKPAKAYVEWWVRQFGTVGPG